MKSFILNLFITVQVQKLDGEVLVKTAEQTSSLRDLGPELGIEQSRRYISDDVVSWKLTLHLQGSHCIDKILSFEGDTLTHRWDCSKDGCLLPCTGYMCEEFYLSVISEITVEDDNDLANNCGHTVEISLSKLDQKVLDFAVFGISEIAIISQGNLV